MRVEAHVFLMRKIAGRSELRKGVTMDKRVRINVMEIVHSIYTIIARPWHAVFQSSDRCYPADDLHVPIRRVATFYVLSP